jgi:hypothetical protein
MSPAHFGPSQHCFSTAPQRRDRCHGTGVSGTPPAGDDAADGPAGLHDPPDPRRDRAPGGPHHGRHAVGRLRRPAHDDAALARHPDPGLVRCPAAAQPALGRLGRFGRPGRLPRRGAAHEQRRGRCPGHPARATTTMAAVPLGPAHADQNARPPVRPPRPGDRGVMAPPSGPCRIAPAGHVRPCSDQARRRARCRPRVVRAHAPACWDARPGWGHAPATTGTARSRPQRPS